ncbi:hypothetical protein HN748_00235 [Candidatus Peregrinibacteria bacterium]|jgi:hypothetical protein|nr:hypothetical protein [Candidatus Peregrinibacteria bacterium]MBT7483925.1 hypothetical protein [Candidatus Peregrinibacteria bacterium]MBT7702640.1 hypothetical protein [Candidatus Peregrinibacteria bacterium]
MDPQVTRTKSLSQGQNRPSRTYSKVNYRQAVLATLAYFDQFQYPLTLEETERFLFQLEPDRHHIEITLKESQLIQGRGSYYQLSQEADHIAERHLRALVAKRLWKRINRFRVIFGLVPYLKLVAVCNNLALSNSKPGSDIDLFIVTKPGRLFISRLILTVWLQLLGVRRHGSKIAGRFCLSFFVTEENLDFNFIKKEPLDIYLAYWFQTLQPIQGNREIYEKLLTKNSDWLQKIFMRPLHPNMHRFKEAPLWARSLRSLQEKILNTSLGDKLEEKLENWQITRAQKKRDLVARDNPDHGIIISRHMLKFHNVDRRELFYKRWIKTLEVLLK